MDQLKIKNEKQMECKRLISQCDSEWHIGQVPSNLQLQCQIKFSPATVRSAALQKAPEHFT